MHGRIVRLAMVVAVGLVSISAWAADSTPAAPAATTAPATGTIEFSGGSAGLGIGFSWGSGTLTFQGKQYPISASGFAVGDLGVSDVRAHGKVYNLSTLSAFDGSYSGYAAGAALVKGGDAVSMVNQNGVQIELVSDTDGVKLTFGGDNVNFKIEK